MLKSAFQSLQGGLFAWRQAAFHFLPLAESLEGGPEIVEQSQENTPLAAKLLAVQAHHGDGSLSFQTPVSGDGHFCMEGEMIGGFRGAWIEQERFLSVQIPTMRAGAAFGPTQRKEIALE